MPGGTGKEVGEQGERKRTAAELDAAEEPLDGFKGEPRFGTHLDLRCNCVLVVMVVWMLSG